MRAGKRNDKGLDSRITVKPEFRRDAGNVRSQAFGKRRMTEVYRL